MATNFEVDAKYVAFKASSFLSIRCHWYLRLHERTIKVDQLIRSDNEAEKKDNHENGGGKLKSAVRHIMRPFKRTTSDPKGLITPLKIQQMYRRIIITAIAVIQM